jgi:quercetin dioxygenase-like cupin family protein
MVSDPRMGASGATGIIRGPGAGLVVPLGDAAEVTLKVTGEETDGRLSAYECTVPPATAGPPVHLHRGWDEAFYVLEGEMTFLIDGQTSLAPAGSFVFIPRSIPHTFWNESMAPARQLTVFTPSGIEAYFADVTQVMAAGGGESLETAMAVMERHDMVVLPGERPAYGALADSDPPTG